MATPFPQFWLDLETDLGDHNDFSQVKSVLSVLGYLTKSSISTIKNKKIILSLESDYLKLRSNENKFKTSCERFPDLKEIDHFTPGLIAVITELVGHINNKSKPVEYEPDDLMLKKLVTKGKKSCKNFDETNVIFEDAPSGRQCIIICPICQESKGLGSSFNEATGKYSYSMFNFTRHVKVHRVQSDPSILETFENDPLFGGCSTSNCIQPTHDATNMLRKVDTKISENRSDHFQENQKQDCENCRVLNDEIVQKEMTISDLKQNLEKLNQSGAVEGVDLQNLLKERNAKIEEYEQRLKMTSTNSDLNQLIPCDKCNILEKQVHKMEKMLAENESQNAELIYLRKIHAEKHRMFSVKLCSFEPIESTDSIQFKNDGAIKFTDCQGSVRQLIFDGFHNGDTADAKFSGLKSYVDAFIEGETVCVFTHGVTGSGKSSTMFGLNGELGILSSSANHILKHGAISVSVVEFTDQETYDLSSGIKVQMDGKNLSPITEIIYTASEFNLFVQQAAELRLQKSTNQNLTSSRSHLIFIMKLQHAPQGEMVFVDLAGFESGSGKENIRQTKYINSTLTDINMILINFSRGCVANFTANTLTMFLKPYLQPRNKTLMLYHVTKSSIKMGLELVKDFVPSTLVRKRSIASTSVARTVGKNNASKPNIVQRKVLQTPRYNIR